MNWTSIEEPPDPVKITEIDLSYKNIKDFPRGRGKCRELQTLDCYWN